MSNHKRILDEHPSYGLASLSRCSSSGGRKLFGSHLKDHYNTVRLTITRAQRESGDGLDHYYPRGRLIEVELSAAQFAELITTMNTGPGVPCTIQNLIGMGTIPAPPDDETEADRAETSFKEQLKTLASQLETKRLQLEGLLEKKGALTKGERKKLSACYEWFVQEIGASIPYMSELFHEATTKMTSAAKTEIEAFMVTGVQRAGLQALGVPQNPMPEQKLLKKGE